MGLIAIGGAFLLLTACDALAGHGSARDGGGVRA
jgi:hypothetical protein